MFREAIAYRTGKKTEGDIADEKKNGDFDFIMDDNTEQVVDFVKEEKERYLWDSRRNEWYIPFGGHVRYTPDYPIKKYRKGSQYSGAVLGKNATSGDN